MAKNIDEMLLRIDTKLDDMSGTICKVDKEVALQKAAFDEHIKQDEKMYEQFRRMNDILQQNTDSLREHMHRTELLESLVTKMDQRLTPIEREKIREEAISQYRNEKLIKIAKIVGVLATLIGIMAAAKPYLLKLLLI